MTIYEIGFCKKAEECGIDPYMLKEAANIISQAKLFNILKDLRVPRKFSFKNNPYFLTSKQKEELLKYIDGLPEHVSFRRVYGSRPSISRPSINGLFNNPFEVI